MCKSLGDRHDFDTEFCFVESLSYLGNFVLYKLYFNFDDDQCLINQFPVYLINKYKT